jgi:multidrug efflux system membrane fusion protein
MRIKSSYLFAGAILLLVIGYFVARPLLGGGEEEKAKQAKGPEQQEVQLVRVAVLQEASHPDRVAVRGRTEAARTVVVRSETAGLVSSTPVPEGAFVRAGQVLCRLDVDARQATLDQARAQLRAKQLQYQAAQQLAEKGFRSQTQVLQQRAELDQASAQVRSAEVALDQVNIRAPFTGVLDDREAEIGSYLGPGQTCGTLVELSPILLVGNVTETEAPKIRLGAPAQATLASGERVAGRVRYVSREADPATRTYKVEVAAANPGARIRSGLSADISIQSGAAAAHLVPVSALVLDSQGRQGVRFIQGADTVAFAPVRILEETPEGVWVTGLAGPVKLITVGQSFVSEGEKVRVASSDKVQVAER